MSPDAPKLSLTGQMQAKISGVSRGTDISLMVFGGICLIGTLGCFWLSLWQPWAAAGSVIFLLCFIFILYVWRQGTPARAQAEAPPAQLTWKSDGNELAVSIPVDSQNYVVKQMLSRMRAIVHSRTPLPSPHGEVRGSPTDEKSLKEYSDDERRAVAEKWSAEISTHDHTVVEQLELTMKSLESGNSEICESTDSTDTGMPQLPKGPTSEPKVPE